MSDIPDDFKEIAEVLALAEETDDPEAFVEGLAEFKRAEYREVVFEDEEAGAWEEHVR